MSMISSPLFWVMSIAVIWANSIIYLFKAQKFIKESPDLRLGYYKIAFGFGFVFSLPCLIGWLGVTYGGMAMFQDFFTVNVDNPFNLAWWVSLIFLDVFLVVWIFFLDGAKKFIQHPGFFTEMTYRLGLITETSIKFFTIVILISQISAILLFQSGFYSAIPAG